MAFNHDERVTGQDAILKWGTEEFSVSSVSWSRDVSTSDVQHNDDLNAKKLVTGLRFSGSFDYNGRNFDLMNQLVRQHGDDAHQTNEPYRGTLSVTETKVETDDAGNTTTTKYIYTFTGVIVTSQSRDLPADDTASSSWDWEAEKLSVKEKAV